MALTYNTLLSSQGTDAHQPRAVRPEIRATFQIYPLTPTKSISHGGHVWSDNGSLGTGLASPFLPREIESYAPLGAGGKSGPDR